MFNMLRFRRIANDKNGASAIEFALVAAFLMLPLTIGVYDFGTALYDWLQVGNAARAGAQYINVNGYSSCINANPQTAQVNPGCGSSAYTTAANPCPNPPINSFSCAVQSATSLGNSITVTVSPAYCGCQNGTTFTSKQGVFNPPCNACGGSYTTGCCKQSNPNEGTPVTLAQVNASYTYFPIFTYLGLGPSNGISIGASATALLY
jgi:Flp pilus assembly pilin Flp